MYLTIYCPTDGQYDLPTAFCSFHRWADLAAGGGGEPGLEDKGHSDCCAASPGGRTYLGAGNVPDGNSMKSLTFGGAFSPEPW